MTTTTTRPKHHEVLETAQKLVRRYRRNPELLGSSAPTAATIAWCSEFHELSQLLKSHKARRGLLKLAYEEGHGREFQKWLETFHHTACTVRTTGRTQPGAESLERLLEFFSKSRSPPGKSPSSSQPAEPTAEPTVLTVDETAELLSVDRKTLYAAIKRNEIPGVRRIGRSIRIHRETFLEWFSSNSIPQENNHV